MSEQLVLGSGGSEVEVEYCTRSMGRSLCQAIALIRNYAIAKVQDILWCLILLHSRGRFPTKKALYARLALGTDSADGKSVVSKATRGRTHSFCIIGTSPREHKIAGPVSMDLQFFRCCSTVSLRSDE